MIKNPPKRIDWYYPNVITQVTTQQKELYLTFDDGPIPEVTPQVLQLLEQYNALATFFMVGENVAKYPNLYNEVIAKGHSIGNHTYNHLKGWKTNSFTYIKNVLKAQSLVNSNLFRPPYGKISKKQYSALCERYTMVFWSVLSEDYNPSKSVKECFKNVLKATKPGGLIVFHDSLKAKNNMLGCLELTLSYYSKKGYTFKALPYQNLY